MTTRSAFSHMLSSLFIEKDCDNFACSLSATTRLSSDYDTSAVATQVEAGNVPNLPSQTLVAAHDKPSSPSRTKPNLIRIDLLFPSLVTAGRAHPGGCLRKTAAPLITNTLACSMTAS